MTTSYQEAIKDDPELYDWILNYDEFQNLEIALAEKRIKEFNEKIDSILFKME